MGYRTHKDKERLEDVEELTCTGLVICLQSSCKDLDHSRKKQLERFLQDMSTDESCIRIHDPYDIVFIVGIDILRDCPQRPIPCLVTLIRIQETCTHLTVVILTSALSGSWRRVSNSLKKLWRCSWNPSTIFSRTVNKMYTPTSRCSTVGETAV